MDRPWKSIAMASSVKRHDQPATPHLRRSSWTAEAELLVHPQASLSRPLISPSRLSKSVLGFEAATHSTSSPCQ